MTDVRLGPCVYVFIVLTAGPEAYFKIGHSSDFASRIDAVQTGCPLPIDRVLWLPTDHHYNATALERALHQRFKSRHTHGEWFVFDLTESIDKEDFKAGCDEVLGAWRTDWAWRVWDESGFQAQKRSRLRSRQRMDPEVQRQEQRRRDVELAICLGGLGRHRTAGA